MCERCRSGAVDIRLAEKAVEAVGDLKFWRPLTPVEVEFGDIERVAADVNDSEVAIVQEVSSPLKDVVREIVSAALVAAKSGDVTKAIEIKKPDTAELEKAIKSSIGSAIEVGKRQVFDQYRKQTGSKLALPPRLKPKLVGKFIVGKSKVQADMLVNEAIAAAQKGAIAQIGREAYDAEALEAFVTGKAGEILKDMARDDAREANGMGRRIAAEDTADEIEAVVYTAVMDSGVCPTCEERDGDEYGAEDLGQAPNPDCEGAMYAGCRCAELIIYKKG